MKKIMMLFMAALLLFSLSGQAMAYFEDEHLIRVVYNRGGTYEIVTDLGSGWDLTSPTSATHVFNTDNFSLTDLGIASWDTAYVAYFIVETYNPISGTQNRVWTSGPLTSQTSMSRAYDAFLGNAHYIAGANSISGDAQNVNLQSTPNSYKNRFGIAGRFGSFLTTTGNGDKLLTDLATVGYVDQYLYYYANPNNAAAGVQLFSIRTNADGTTEINPNAVPIPAAAYLFGSGLLSLIGIRRRMTA